MRKATVFLMALALIIIITAANSVQQTVATPPPAAALRRSRFLANKKPPPSFYDCSKKTKAICLAEGSPGPTCCGGACVDTDYSYEHCGNCHNMCQYPRTCCEGKCVNTFTSKKNCGGCGVKCRTKCTYGYCDYAA